MQRSGTILVISGTLIVAGLVLMMLGSQVVLQEISQGDGKINFEQPLTITNDFDAEKHTAGIYAVQVIDHQEEAISIKIIDPFGSEVFSQKINKEKMEDEFDVDMSGTYELIIESSGKQDTQAFGAIGPRPDSGKETLGVVSMYILIAGMVGIAGSGIYGLKNRLRSV